MFNLMSHHNQNNVGVPKVRVRVCVCVTVGKSVDPIVAEVHPKETSPPGPGRVPGQLHQTVVVPDVNVSTEFTASHE